MLQLPSRMPAPRKSVVSLAGNRLYRRNIPLSTLWHRLFCSGHGCGCPQDLEKTRSRPGVRLPLLRNTAVCQLDEPQRPQWLWPPQNASCEGCTPVLAGVAEGLNVSAAQRIDSSHDLKTRSHKEHIKSCNRGPPSYHLYEHIPRL